MFGFNRRHSSIKNNNNINFKDPPLLNSNGGATMDLADKAFGCDSARESVCPKKQNLKDIQDIESGPNNENNVSIGEFRYYSTCCRQKLQQKSLAKSFFFQKQQKNIPRLVDKEGNCLIRPVNIPNPCFNLFK